MITLANRISRIQPSATLEMTAKAAELKRLKKPVYNMSVGEPDFSTPKNIQKAGIYAIQNGHTKYTPGSGTYELKKAIINKLERDNNIKFEIDQIVISCGGKHSLYNACQALFQKGDEVIIFKPYWVSFPDFVSITGAEPVFVQTETKKQFEPNFKDLRNKITNKTKGIIINSPSNPTGGVWSDEAVKKTIKIAKDNNIWVFSDECYEQLTYKCKFKSIASVCKYKKIITFQSCSKTYAMTGWRIGYIAGNVDLVRSISKLQGQSTSCPNSIAQHAAVEALMGGQASVKKMRDTFYQRRNLILDLLHTIPNIMCEKPKGAFYVFPDFKNYLGTKTKNNLKINSSKDLCMYFLEEAGVVAVAGESFGAPGHIRFSYATSEETIKTAMSLIKNSLKKLVF